MARTYFERTIPNEMRALQLDQYISDAFEAIQSLKVVSKPVPKPSSGQVLIRVEAAPCNPSDLLFLQGRYGKRKTLPAVPGWEGAGLVVAGNGFMAKWLKGKRVAFSNQSDQGGTWAEYCVADAHMCVPLKDNVSSDQGASLLINPLTALGLFESVDKAFIQNAAASQVGKMILSLAQERDIPGIHIVRKKEQETLLKDLGAKIVLNSETDGFEKLLKSESARLNANVAFDAVGGGMTGRLLHAMPAHSKVLVYGALSGKECAEIGPIDLIFQEKSVSGFYLGGWIKSKSFLGLYQATSKVQKKLADGSFHTSISAEASLEEAPKALESYQKSMTQGKILIKP